MTAWIVVAPYQSVFEVSPAGFLKFSTPPSSRGPPLADSCNSVFEILPGGFHVRGVAQRQNHEGIMPANRKLDPRYQSRTPATGFMQFCFRDPAGQNRRNLDPRYQIYPRYHYPASRSTQGSKFFRIKYPRSISWERCPLTRGSN